MTRDCDCLCVSVRSQLLPKNVISLMYIIIILILIILIIIIIITVIMIMMMMMMIIIIIIIIIITKNVNRLDSHGHHGSKRTCINIG